MLTVRNLCKTFHGGTVNEVRALHGVSLELPEASFLVIVGGNGSGKSTLLNAIAGCFRLDDGEIHLEGHNITRWPEHRRARLIGRVFQNPFTGSAPNMSVAENLALAARRGLPRTLGRALSKRLMNELHEQVRQLEMGLEDRLGNAIGSLSGGQRQALTLLMATWRRPAVLLLDEHTAALDPKSADQVLRVTEAIVQRHKLTTLMVTHSMSQAVNLGDRIVMMHKGSVAYRFAGADKQRLGVDDLLTRFEDLRRRELLDETAAALLEETYV
ncbi:MAG: ATP-binding cassette domain-containing protein [Planctomycetaceae bacterium]|nr:ATP-binding cassette domain-containing protein [Planctomycetaceae bacterium]